MSAAKYAGLPDIVTYSSLVPRVYGPVHTLPRTPLKTYMKHQIRLQSLIKMYVYHTYHNKTYIMFIRARFKGNSSDEEGVPQRGSGIRARGGDAEVPSREELDPSPLMSAEVAGRKFRNAEKRRGKPTGRPHGLHFIYSGQNIDPV